MINKDFLKKIAARHEISNVELETLFLAVNGNSTEEISEQLQIEPGAIRKRLSEVYRKFNISGKGPGKLPKLQALLMSAYQKQQDESCEKLSSDQVPDEELSVNGLEPELRRMSVVVLHFSEDGKQVAEGLSSTILKHPLLDARIQAVDTLSPGFWKHEFEKLKNADFCIGCIVKNSFNRPLTTFAVGFLLGELQHFKLVRFYPESLDTPLDYLSRAEKHQPSVINGDNVKDLAKLLHDMIGGEFQDAEDWVEFRFSSWHQQFIEQISKVEQNEQLEVDNIVSAGLRLLDQNEYVLSNTCFRQLFINSLQETAAAVQKVNQGYVYSLPADQYPRCLIGLQRELTPTVRAIALVNTLEHFWSDDSGNEIWETVTRQSQRLFVFSKLRDFEQTLGVLARHARKYEVFVLLKEQYEPSIQEYNINPEFDFSIIKTDDSKIVARYGLDETDESRSRSLIHFSADPAEANLYETALERAINLAKEYQLVVEEETKANELLDQFEKIRQRFREELLVQKPKHAKDWQRKNRDVPIHLNR